MIPRPSSTMLFALLYLMLALSCSTSPRTARTQQAAEAVEKPAPATSTGELTVLFTNDFHGRYMPFEVGRDNATSQVADPGGPWYTLPRAGRVGGFAHLATAIERARQEAQPNRTVLVHAGDTFSDDLLGNITEGAAMIRLMNAVGYDFAALGNHDFDYGAQRTRELARMAAFPIRAANVLEASTGEPFLGPPFQVIQLDTGVRVGLLALGYHNTALTTHPKNVRELRFISGIEAAKRHLPALRERADVIVAVSHQGLEVDRLLAREVDGIDVIIGGHSHDAITQVDHTHIVQAWAYGAMLGGVTLRVRDGRVRDVELETHLVWADAYPADERVSALIDELRGPHEARLTEPIATAESLVGRNYKSESPFDQLVGDYLMDETGAELALLPGVGYGIALRPGPITREQLHALLPHPAKVVTLELTGAQVLRVLEQSALNLDPADRLDAVGGLVQTAGMSWTVDLAAPPGERISEVRVGEVLLDAGRRYRVVTHSGMLAGIHGYDEIAKGMNVQTHDQKVVDLVEKKMGEQQPVTVRP